MRYFVEVNKETLGIDIATVEFPLEPPAKPGLAGDHPTFFVEVTGMDPLPTVGWTYEGRGRFAPPAEPTP